ncbi:ATP-binding protein [Salinimonas chungwhensis]|uniref:ATP-binding protein n=1 Tax=Salinimonas chungwhensis TaxID=265425 RepID=UPI000366340E|nr:ATP-binding protein [Salinimonas chungwhensis]
MTASPARLSIRSLFLWVIMAIATTTLVISTGLSLSLQINAYRDDLKETVVMLADIIGQNAAMDIARGDDTATVRHLDTMAQVDIVTHVHAYWLNPNRDNNLSFLASYHREGEPPIQDQSGRIDLFNAPVIGDSVIEFARPVMFNNRYAGYIYLSASAVQFNHLVTQAILLNLAVLLVMMVLTFILALRFQSLLTKPIEALADFLQSTSRVRDYSARTPSSSIRELNILTDAVNVLLARMQDHVQKQRETEEQHRALNASLEDIVSQRTVALKEANQELIQTLEKLHQYQRQIVENEKMSSLGDMVAGVAHEVNTPIGLGVTASTMMLDQIVTIQQNFDSRTLKASSLDRFLRDSQENLNIIYRNLNRAAELISSFKQVAVDQTAENSRTFCVSQLINEILVSLRPQLKKHHHKINVHCDPTLHVETKAGPINQILINLIVNSVIHGFEDTDSGTIDITVDLMTSSMLKLVYKDNGKGIADDIRKRIFEPFVTTRRGEGGSGLGMHLVYNLVTQVLNGSITLSSEEGHGVEFLIVFPVEPASAGIEKN